MLRHLSHDVTIFGKHFGRRSLSAHQQLRHFLVEINHPNGSYIRGFETTAIELPTLLEHIVQGQVRANRPGVRIAGRDAGDRRGRSQLRRKEQRGLDPDVADWVDFYSPSRGAYPAGPVDCVLLPVLALAGGFLIPILAFAGG
jgi:hypothetical protein